MKTKTATELQQALASSSPPRVIDVRTGMEFAGGHIPQAVNLPLSGFPGHLERLRGQSGTIWVICQSGARSAQASKMIAGAGLDCVNVTDGMSGYRGPVVEERSWARLGLPLIVSLTLGLAPFTPEPHLVGKIRWVLGGAVGMGMMDWWDLVMHGAPWVWLLWTAVRVARTPAKPPAS